MRADSIVVLFVILSVEMYTFVKFPHDIATMHVFLDEGAASAFEGLTVTLAKARALVGDTFCGLMRAVVS
jgi:hypothetical protein